jgi:DNA-binding transcriptional regulator GbsR (MarR family)
MVTWRDRFVQAFGDAADRSGVLSEMAGKLYGALYISTGPLSLDELCDAVAASKGNVSVQVRQLLDLGMVRRVPLRPGRRHYYEAATDLWPIATELIGRRLEQEARTFLRALEEVERDIKPKTGDAVVARVASMRVFMQLAIGMVEGFRRGDVLKSEALRKAGS